MSIMENRSEIKPPLKGVRLFIGFAFLASGVFLLSVVFGSGGPDIFPMLPALIFLPVGAGLAFLERVIGVDSGRREAFSEWRVCGLVLRRRVFDISTADQVAIITRQEALIPDAGTIYVADKTFPVVLRVGDQTLFRAIGWDFPNAEKKCNTDISLPTGALFPSFSRHVAARLAVALHLPLADESTGECYGPDAIPSQWLDSKSVSAQAAWRRY